jgi:hypothetical protein
MILVTPRDAYPVSDVSKGSAKRILVMRFNVRVMNFARMENA